ncbi:MAG: glutamate-cysteine ligase family protein [Planctomycetota bacterium]
MPGDTRVHPDELRSRLTDLLVGSPMPKGRRMLGIEYERFLLDAEGRSAPTAFSIDLMRRLVDRLGAKAIAEGDLVKGLIADEFDLSLEPGGQLEVAFPPFERLSEVDRVMAKVDAELNAELEGSGYNLHAFGCAPETRPDELELLPRPRYGIMDREMVRRGDLSQWMMRATAGFQITYDFESAEDAATKIAMLYRLSPVFLATTANSRRAGGQDTGYASYRHHIWSRTDTDRSGVPDGCLHPSTAISGYVEYACKATVLFQERDGRIVEAEHISLQDLVARGDVTEADLELHLSSLFPHVRPRNYLEVRCFDGLPWSEARSVIAWISGLVYCPHATKAAFELSEEFAIDDPQELLALHERAAKQGLDAQLRPGRTLRDVARELVRTSMATLGGPSCDWASTEDLQAVAARVEAPVGTV